jgi:hypothetical protein
VKDRKVDAFFEVSRTACKPIPGCCLDRLFLCCRRNGNDIRKFSRTENHPASATRVFAELSKPPNKIGFLALSGLKRQSIVRKGAGKCLQ